ncbi:hypothetical protein GW17_00033250 [Ensete ventricosum]|nr:hypothetical protein GW17_00033250 [Ensete ventricosum]
MDDKSEAWRNLICRRHCLPCPRHPHAIVTVGDRTRRGPPTRASHLNSPPSPRRLPPPPTRPTPHLPQRISPPPISTVCGSSDGCCGSRTGRARTQRSANVRVFTIGYLSWKSSSPPSKLEYSVPFQIKPVRFFFSVGLDRFQTRSLSERWRSWTLTSSATSSSPS